MATVDWENLRSGRMSSGTKVDCGTFDFSNGSQTADVGVTLARCYGGIALADLSATTDPQQTLYGYKVGDCSSGAITFIRAGGKLDEDAHMSFIVWGY